MPVQTASSTHEEDSLPAPQQAYALSGRFESYPHSEEGWRLLPDEIWLGAVRDILRVLKQEQGDSLSGEQEQIDTSQSPHDKREERSHSRVRKKEQSGTSQSPHDGHGHGSHPLLVEDEQSGSLGSLLIQPAFVITLHALFLESLRRSKASDGVFAQAIEKQDAELLSLVRSGECLPQDRVIDVVKAFVSLAEPALLWVWEAKEWYRELLGLLEQQADLQITDVWSREVRSEFFEQERAWILEQRGYQLRVRLRAYLRLGIWSPRASVLQAFETLSPRLEELEEQTTLSRGEWLEVRVWCAFFLHSVLESERTSFTLYHSFLRSFLWNFLYFKAELPTPSKLEKWLSDVVRDHRERGRYSETNRPYCIWVSRQLLPVSKGHLQPTLQGIFFEVSPSLLAVMLRGLRDAQSSELLQAEQCSLVEARSKALKRGSALLILSEDVNTIKEVGSSSPERLGLSCTLFLLSLEERIELEELTTTVQGEELLPLRTLVTQDLEESIRNVQLFFVYLEILGYHMERVEACGKAQENEHFEIPITLVEQGIRLFEAVGASDLMQLFLKRKQAQGDPSSDVLLALLQGRLRKAYLQACELSQVGRNRGNIEEAICWRSVSHLLGTMGMLSVEEEDTLYREQIHELSQALHQQDPVKLRQPGWRSVSLANMLSAHQPLERLLHLVTPERQDLLDLVSTLTELGKMGSDNLFASALKYLEHEVKISEIKDFRQCSEHEARQLYGESLDFVEQMRWEDETGEMTDDDPRFYPCSEEIQNFLPLTGLKAQVELVCEKELTPGSRFALPRTLLSFLFRLWDMNVAKHAQASQSQVVIGPGHDDSLSMTLADPGVGIEPAILEVLAQRTSSFVRLLLESGWCSRVFVISCQQGQEPRVVPLLGKFMEEESEETLSIKMPYPQGTAFVLEFPCKVY